MATAFAHLIRRLGLRMLTSLFANCCPNALTVPPTPKHPVLQLNVLVPKALTHFPLRAERVRPNALPPAFVLLALGFAETWPRPPDPVWLPTLLTNLKFFTYLFIHSKKDGVNLAQNHSTLSLSPALQARVGSPASSTLPSPCLISYC